MSEDYDDAADAYEDQITELKDALRRLHKSLGVCEIEGKRAPLIPDINEFWAAYDAAKQLF